MQTNTQLESSCSVFGSSKEDKAASLKISQSPSPLTSNRPKEIRLQSTWYQSRLQIARSEFIVGKCDVALNLCSETLGQLRDLHREQKLLRDLNGQCCDVDLRVKYIAMFLALVVQIYYEMPAGDSPGVIHRPLESELSGSGNEDLEERVGKKRPKLRGVDFAFRFYQERQLIMHPVVTRLW